MVKLLRLMIAFFVAQLVTSRGLGMNNEDA